MGIGIQQGRIRRQHQRAVKNGGFALIRVITHHNTRGSNFRFSVDRVA